MKLYRPALSALAFFVAAPALGLADAEAAFIRRTVIKQKQDTWVGSWKYRVSTTVSGDAPAATVRAELESDAGSEELDLVETDAWLHGAATITALPKEEAELTLTLYDSASGAIASFSGTLDTDGMVTLASDTGKYDVEVLAAEVFSATKGYDLSLDLAGADTYAVAYASIVVTEGSTVCLAYGEKGECLKWDTSKEVITKSEVFWDDIGAVWEADATLAHEGLIESKVKLYDAEGEKLETAKAKIGEPWLDDGEGVSSLATDEDPLTRVAFHRGQRGYHATRAKFHRRTVVSEGWSASGTLPVAAEMELTNGETTTIPVNSYQKKTPKVEMYCEDIRFRYNMSWAMTVSPGSGGGSVSFDGLTEAELASPVCSEGYCLVMGADSAGELSLSITAYGEDAGTLTDATTVKFTASEKGEVVCSGEVNASFDQDITAVFATEISYASDPVGLGLAGRVTLLGAPNKKGRQETLAKGKFSGEFSRDADGDLELGGGDKDEVVSAGSVVVAGEALSINDGKGGVDAPPVVVYGVAGNGSGTKNASSSTSTRPQLL